MSPAFPDCKVCFGSGFHEDEPCPSCVWRKWYADGVANGTLKTLEEVQADQAEEDAEEAQIAEKNKE